MIDDMGTRLIIPNADFENYVEIETEFSTKIINDFEYVKNKQYGGCADLGVPYFGSYADKTNQLGLMNPIDIEGISYANIVNSYGQTKGIHAKVLDINGNFVKDIIGSSINIDSQLYVDDFPSNSKWLFVNHISTSTPSLTIGGYFNESKKESITKGSVVSGSYIKADGVVRSSDEFEGTRQVVDYPCQPGQRILIVGIFNVTGVQGLCSGVFTDNSNSVISPITPDTDSNCVSVVSCIVPEGATKFRANTVDYANPFAFIIKD